MSDALEKNARTLKELEVELEKALRHCRMASLRFEEGNVPNACAHILALEGHIQKVHLARTSIAITHSEHAILEEK